MATVQSVIKNIRDLAEERPDFVYEAPEFDASEGGPECLYVHPGNQPGCIVGHALMMDGVAAEALIKFDNTYANGIGVRAGVVTANLCDDTPTQQEQWWMDSVQSNQDSGKTWSESVQFADSVYSLD